LVVVLEKVLSELIVWFGLVSEGGGEEEEEEEEEEETKQQQKRSDGF
jgi:hypothetical protein